MPWLIDLITLTEPLLQYVYRRQSLDRRIDGFSPAEPLGPDGIIMSRTQSARGPGRTPHFRLRGFLAPS